MNKRNGLGQKSFSWKHEKNIPYIGNKSWLENRFSDFKNLEGSKNYKSKTMQISFKVERKIRS